MEFASLGSFFGGLGQLVGGASGLFGRGGGGSSGAENFAREQLNFQREAARHGISWRVADAKEAGIHPLYALGSPSFNPSPVSFPVGDTAGVDVGGSLAQMGQGVSRAIAATQTKNEREMTIEDILIREQTLERGSLENELLRARIASEYARTAGNSAQVGPPMAGPSPLTAATNQSTVKENELVSTQGNVPHQAAGPVAGSSQWRVAPDGVVYPTPIKDLQMDDMGSPGWAPYMYRNHVLPFAKQVFKGSQSLDVEQYAPPVDYLPKGASHWRKTLDGGWEPVYGSNHRLDRPRYSSGAGYGGTDPARYRR